jgi:NADPH-dependent 7-cyano-7-deazaguanine reductase QueF
VRVLETVENTTDGTLQVVHTLDLPPCCPISKNPRPGSRIEIAYIPTGKSLEVASLFAYIHQFKGGLRNEEGQLVVRDMEGMLLRIANGCAQVTGVPVHLMAHLLILPKQEMEVDIWSYPKAMI